MPKTKASAIALPHWRAKAAEATAPADADKDAFASTVANRQGDRGLRRVRPLTPPSQAPPDDGRSCSSTLKQVNPKCKYLDQNYGSILEA